MTDSPSEASESVARSTNAIRRRPFRQQLHSLVRWLHIYSSLLGLMVTLFFGVTGLTVNHPEWFSNGYESTRDDAGTIDTALLGSADQEPSRLEIVEVMRGRYTIHAAVRDVQVDDFQITIAFAGPGYTADISIDRETAEYQFNEVRLGLVAIINDLHKGRDTGPVWSLVIDGAAILLVFISLSGVLLLCWLKRRWRSGLITIAIGSVITAVMIWVTVS